MQEKITAQTHKVIAYGLDVKERLERGERPNFELEQQQLKDLLLGDSEMRHNPDYAGEGRADSVMPGVGGGRAPFQGARYALTCWLDEIFILDSPWGREWNERSLEMAIYGTRIRAERFWDQVRLAENRTG